MFNWCGDAGTSTSKIKDFHGPGWVPDFCILTTKSPFGCSFEITASKLPLSSEIRTACIGGGTGGKRFARMAMVKRSGKQLASKTTVARRSSDQTPHGSREDQLPARTTPDGSLFDNLIPDPGVTGSRPPRSSAAEPSLDSTNNRGPPLAWVARAPLKMKLNPQNSSAGAPRRSVTSGRGTPPAP